MKTFFYYYIAIALTILVCITTYSSVNQYQNELQKVNELKTYRKAVIQSNINDFEEIRELLIVYGNKIKELKEEELINEKLQYKIIYKKIEYTSEGLSKDKLNDFEKINLCRSYALSVKHYNTSQLLNRELARRIEERLSFILERSYNIVPEK